MLVRMRFFVAFSSSFIFFLCMPLQRSIVGEVHLGRSTCHPKWTTLTLSGRKGEGCSRPDPPQEPKDIYPVNRMRFIQSTSRRTSWCDGRPPRTRDLDPTPTPETLPMPSRSRSSARSTSAPRRANMAHIRQPRPDSGLGFKARFLPWLSGKSL